MTMKYFANVFYLLFFLISFGYKWRLHTTYPKREVPLKAPESFFWENPFLKKFAVSYTGDFIGDVEG